MSFWLQEVKTGLSNTTEKLKKTSQAKEEMSTKFEVLKKEFEKLEENFQAKVKIANSVISNKYFSPKWTFAT